MKEFKVCLQTDMLYQTAVSLHQQIFHLQNMNLIISLVLKIILSLTVVFHIQYGSMPRVPPVQGGGTGMWAKLISPLPNHFHCLFACAVNVEHE